MLPLHATHLQSTQRTHAHITTRTWFARVCAIKMIIHCSMSAHDIAETVALHEVQLLVLLLPGCGVMITLRKYGIHVIVSIEENAARRSAIPPRTPDFLSVPCHTLANALVHNDTHITLVNSHAKGDGGAHHLHFTCMLRASAVHLEPRTYRAVHCWVRVETAVEKTSTKGYPCK